MHIAVDPAGRRRFFCDLRQARRSFRREPPLGAITTEGRVLLKTTTWATLALGLVLACNGNDERQVERGNRADRGEDAASSSGGSSGTAGADGGAASSSSSGSSGRPQPTEDAPLVVHAAAERTRLGARTLRNGSFFAVLDVSVANVSQSAFALSFANFRLVVGGVEIVATPESTELDDACPATGFLTAGGTIDCSVAFEASAVPERIVLVSALEADGEIVRLEADVPAFDRCDRCGEDSCVDLQTSTAHCGTCDHALPPEARACVDGVVECRDERILCEGECTADAPALLRECSNLRVVENDSRAATCAVACGTTACVSAHAGYGVVGIPMQVECNEIPPATIVSPLPGPDLPFAWLDCFCQAE